MSISRQAAVRSSLNAGASRWRPISRRASSAMRSPALSSKAGVMSSGRSRVGVRSRAANGAKSWRSAWRAAALNRSQEPMHSGGGSSTRRACTAPACTLSTTTRAWSSRASSNSAWPAASGRARSRAPSRSAGGSRPCATASPMPSATRWRSVRHCAKRCSMSPASAGTPASSSRPPRAPSLSSGRGGDTAPSRSLSRRFKASSAARKSATRSSLAAAMASRCARRPRVRRNHCASSGAACGCAAAAMPRRSTHCRIAAPWRCSHGGDESASTCAVQSSRTSRPRAISASSQPGAATPARSRRQRSMASSAAAGARNGSSSSPKARSGGERKTRDKARTMASASRSGGGCSTSVAACAIQPSSQASAHSSRPSCERSRSSAIACSKRRAELRPWPRIRSTRASPSRALAASGRNGDDAAPRIKRWNVCSPRVYEACARSVWPRRAARCASLTQVRATSGSRFGLVCTSGR